MIKSIIIISDHSPIGKNSAREALRLGAGYMGLGEEIDCKVVLMGDAVYLLSKYADPKVIGVDSFDEPIEMADLSDLELLVMDSALEEAGLTKQDLIEYEGLRIIGLEDLLNYIENADTTFRF
jgi:sulfur relay (sulfurtransferase) DsrF/TusC family protein